MTTLATRRPGVETAAVEATVAETRREVIAILTDRSAEAAWRAYRAGVEPDPRALFALLGRRRLLAPAWPVEYGGRGLTPRHQAAVVDALVELGVVETLHTLSIQIAGTFLLSAGDRAQRASTLPDLAAGRSFCAVLYSEPDVGSDLAALTTTATPAERGGFRLSGRKVYSVKTQIADLALVAARTSVEASRYQGVSLFLVPLRSRGVTIRGLSSIADEQFADVTLDDVWVPGRGVIGPLGGAWPLITDALALERTGVDYHAKARTWLDLWRACHPDPDAGQAERAAKLEAKIDAAGLYADRCLAQLAGGRVDPVLAALTKLWCADVAREVAWWCAEESGPDAIWRATAGPAPRPRPDWRASADPAPRPRSGTAAPHAHRHPGLDRIEAAYREAPGLTISAGTAEMMLEVIAGSGLPSPDADLIGIDEEPLRRAVRAAVRDIAAAYDDDEEPGGWWAELARVQAFGLDVPIGAGGLGLGLDASAAVCEEMGRGALDHGLLDTFTAIDVLAGDALAGGDATAAARLASALAGRYRAAMWDGDASRPMVWSEHIDEVLLLTADRAALIPPPPAAIAQSCGSMRLRHATAVPPPGVPEPGVLAPGVPAPGVPAPGVAGAKAVMAGDPVPVDPTGLRRRDQVRRAAWLTGLATGALAHTVARAREREQFGRALVGHQSVAFRLARLTAETTATRLLTDAAARDDRPRAAARALASACDLAYLVTRESMQLCGAWGMTDSAPAQRFYRAAFVAVGLLGPAGQRWRAAGHDTIGGAPHGR